MGGEGRVMMVKFPYSSMKTIPKVRLNMIRYLRLSNFCPRRCQNISSQPASVFPSR